MNFFYQLLKEDKVGWLRLFVALMVGGFMAGMYYNRMNFTFLDYEKRITRIEKITEMIPELKESLARIEGALRIRR